MGSEWYGWAVGDIDTERGCGWGVRDLDEIAGSGAGWIFIGMGEKEYFLK